MSERDWQKDWKRAEVLSANITVIPAYRRDDEYGAVLRHAYALSEALRYWLREVQELREMNSQLRSALRWALDYMAEDTMPNDTTPHHVCGYVKQPHTGYCHFHEKYWDAHKLLDKEEEENG